MMKLKEGDWYEDTSDQHYPYGIVGEKDEEMVIIFGRTAQQALEAKKTGKIRGWINQIDLTRIRKPLKKLKKEEVVLLLL